MLLRVEGPSGIDEVVITASYDPRPEVKSVRVSPDSPVRWTELAILPDDSLTTTFAASGFGGSRLIARGVSQPIVVPARTIVSGSVTLELVTTGGGDSDGGATDLGHAPADMPAVPDAGGVIAFVQSTAQLKLLISSVSVTYPAPQRSGDLNVVVINNATSLGGAVSSVTDSSGNPYVSAVGPTKSSGYQQSIYYAKNIQGAASNLVTVSFGSLTSANVAILEYSGVSQLDKTAANTGAGTLASAGPVTIAAPPALILGAGGWADDSANGLTGPGVGFTQRATSNGDLVEDLIADQIGMFQATAPLASSARWMMQLVSFK